MTVHAVELDPKPVHRSFRLTRSKPQAAVASQVRPALVLPDGQARKLIAAAERGDVGRGGCFSAGPAGIQIWSGPWDGVLGTHGSSEHHGSIDWCYDTPTRHYITIYRVLVTAAGNAAGVTPQALLDQVLDLAGVQAPQDALALPVPPPRDPFRSDRRATRLS